MSELALAVVDGALHQRLADALHHAAMRLALDQQRIDQTVPKSLTIEYFTTSTTPVSGSISTSATWQPLGKAEGGVSIDER